MKTFIQIIAATFLTLTYTSGYTQDHANHQAAGTDMMAHLDADLEDIRKTDDPSKQKEKLLHHLQMMGEQLKTMSAMDHGAMGGENMKGMDHGAMGGENMKGMDHGAMGGESMNMMQHHQDMVKMMEHMLVTQELILGLIDKK
jgi:hypothetical protein